MFFRPNEVRLRPELRPVDERGWPMEPQGWYLGVCPTDTAFLQARVETAGRIAECLQPDGLLLDFIRFPALWEGWLPGVRRSDIREYCFCSRCVERFCRETGNDLTGQEPADQRRTIVNELRTAWTAWKCGLVATAVSAIRGGGRS